MYYFGLVASSGWKSLKDTCQGNSQVSVAAEHLMRRMPKHTVNHYAPEMGAAYECPRRDCSWSTPMFANGMNPPITFCITGLPKQQAQTLLMFASKRNVNFLKRLIKRAKKFTASALGSKCRDTLWPPSLRGAVGHPCFSCAHRHLQ